MAIASPWRLLLIGLGLALAAGCAPAHPTTSQTASLAPVSPQPAGSPGSIASLDPSGAETAGAPTLAVRAFAVPAGSRPHDVSPAADGGVWYSAQGSGRLGHLDPSTGDIREIPLGTGSSPHGVITGPDGAPWITDSGLNAIVRVDPQTEDVRLFPLPADRQGANLNTAVFDPAGTLWFTGQAGVYGRLYPATGTIEVFDAPRGRGPYGITSTPAGDIWYASLAGSHIALIDPVSGAATVVEPPTVDQGARRVWTDSGGRIWVSEWDVGQVAVHDPATGMWREWRLPGDRPQAYAVFVDDRDIVWLTDFGANAVVRFDPASESFTSVTMPSPGAAVRQLHGRPGEVWGAESAADTLVLITEEPPEAFSERHP
jgi:virginiamycin B lyase